MAVAVSAGLAGGGLVLAGAPAGAKTVCRTVRPSSSKITVSPCERIDIGFEIGTQGPIFPVWRVSKGPAKRVLKFIRGGYEDTSSSGDTTTQYFLYQAVGLGRTTVRFCETTASEPGCLATDWLQVTVRRRRR